MDQLSSILWLVLGVAFIIAEIFTLGFVLFWFGIGAIAASVAGFLGAGLGLQFLIFAVVSIALTVMSRTIFQRYLPTNEGCRFDTTANYMATANRTRRAARTALGHDLASVGMNTKGSDAALGPAQLQQVRWNRYATLFCDPDANGGKPGCTGGPLVAADVTPSKTYFEHETIPMDDGTNGDNWRIASTELVYNITGYEASKPVAKTALESSVMQDRRAEQRAYATQMDAVAALVNDIVADRTPGPAAPEVKAIRVKAGVTDASDHPSAREIRQSIIEQLWDPNYYVDLQDASATTSRKELYLSAYNLMMLNLIVEKTEKIANALAVQTGNLLDFGQGDKRSDQQQANPVR